MGQGAICPARVIWILGMDEGVFPRQSIPLLSLEWRVRILCQKGHIWIALSF